MIFIKLMGFFTAGVLLSLTPCILPMVPIMVSILVGGDKPVTGTRALVLTSTYVLSSSCLFAVLGIFSGLSGTYIQGLLQTPLVIIPMAILLVVMALIQIDIIQIPLTTNDFIARIGITRDSILGASLLGVLSVLTLSPCITPAIVGALSYIGTTGNILEGGLSLFVMGVGMGLPLLIMATVGSQFLPKPGKFMTFIKYVSAAVLIGMSVSMVYNIIPYSNSTQLVDVSSRRIESRVLIFVTSPGCHYCRAIEEALQAGAAKGWTIHRVRTYPGYYGAPNLIKQVNGRTVGSLVGGSRSFNEIQRFLR